MGKFIDNLYRFLPENTFRTLSKYYYLVQRKIHTPFSERDFRHILINDLGIRKGMVVFIHSSVDKLNVSASPFRILEILLETVGTEGTLIFPTWHYTGRAEDYLRTDKTFNVKRSPSVLGLLPELARRHKDAYRSLHPTASVVAIGKHAEELTATHHLDVYPWGTQSPMFLMMKYKARIIGLGEKVVSLSFVHCVEDNCRDDFPVETLSKIPMTGKVKTMEGKIISVPTYVPDKRIGNRDIQGFFDQNIPANICSRFRKRGVNFFICDAIALFEKMKVLSRQGITIYNNTGS